MQRLFSSFAGGWPGVGILLQRLLIGASLIYSSLAIIITSEAVSFSSVVVPFAGIVSGTLFVLGLWTPVAGGLAVTVQAWMVLWNRGDPSSSAALAALAATIIMIGPGAWSLDARLFGRKRLKIPRW